MVVKEPTHGLWMDYCLDGSAERGLACALPSRVLKVREG